jgi:hypothetical protein
MSAKNIFTTILASVLALSFASKAIAEEPVNLIPNPSFEDGGAVPSGWYLDNAKADGFRVSTDGVNTGDRCLKFDSALGNNVLYTTDPVTLKPGQKYRLSAHWRIERVNKDHGQIFVISVKFLDAEGNRIRGTMPGLNNGSRMGISSTYARRNVDFNAPADGATARIAIISRGTRGVEALYYIDDISLIEVKESTYEPPAHIRAYDFNKDRDSALGFIQVDPTREFAKHGDFGWENAPTRYSSTVHNKNYPTTLQGGAVARGHVFKVKLPNGKYRCTVPMGSHWRIDVMEMAHMVSANGTMVVKDPRTLNDLMDTYYFRYTAETLVTSLDFTDPGKAIFDKYIAPRYQLHTFDVDVTHGVLDIKILRGAMSGVLISSIKTEDDVETHDKAIAELKKALEDEFGLRWVNRIPTQNRIGADVGDYTPTAADEKRGYVLFNRYWMRHMEHATRPFKEDLGNSISLFATPGEEEPVTFSFWPLRDIKDMTITVPADLRSENGDVIPAEAVKVWFLQHRQQRVRKIHHEYYIAGMFLPDWNVRPLFTDITQRCWLSIKVPETAKPGTYIGKVRIESPDIESDEVEVSLRVLPYALERPERLHVPRRGANQIIMPYKSEYPFKEGEDVKRNKEYYRRMAIMDIASHGFSPELKFWIPTYVDRETGHFNWEAVKGIEGKPSAFLRNVEDSPLGKQKSIVFDPSAIGRVGFLALFDAYLEGEKTKPGMSMDKIKILLQDIYKKMSDMGYTTVYFHLTAEESHTIRRIGIPGWTRMMDFIRDHREGTNGKEILWPNMYSIHSANSSWGQKVALEIADMTCLGMFHGTGEGTASEQVEMARATGKPFGIYGLRGRITPGFYLWKTGAVGSFFEFYSNYAGAMNNDWDCGVGGNLMLETAPHTVATYSPDQGRMIGSWFWEELREGVDDDAYMVTLENYIERTKGSKDDKVIVARAAAQMAIAEVDSQIDLDRAGIVSFIDRPFAAEDFNGLRWKVALATTRLKAAIDGQALKPSPSGQNIQGISAKIAFTPELPTTGGDMRPRTQFSRITVHPIDTPIIIDGVLNDSAYKTHKPQSTQFIEMRTEKVSKFKTAVTVFADDKNLYIGVRCNDPNIDKIAKKFTETTHNVWRDDSIELFIDSNSDHQTYYHVMANANGASFVNIGIKKFGASRQGSQKCSSTFTVKASINDKKKFWSLEFSIPLKEFDIDYKSLGINITRNSPGPQSQSAWTKIAKGESFHQPDVQADVYLPGATSQLISYTPGLLTMGKNMASFWVSEREGASPLTVTLTDPNGLEKTLTTTRHPEENGIVCYNAPYVLGSDKGFYLFGVRAGDMPLGLHYATYEADFYKVNFDRRTFISNANDAARARVQLILPPGSALDGLSFRAQILKDGVPVDGKTSVISKLESRTFSWFLRLDDLPLGIYDVEFALLGDNNKVLKHTLSEIEVLASGLVPGLAAAATAEMKTAGFDTEIRLGNLGGAITNDRHKDFSPTISRDKKLAYVSKQINQDIWMVDLSAEKPTPVQLTNSPERKKYPQFSPDGKHLAFLLSVGTTTRLQVVNLETMKITDIGLGDDILWSRDSMFIVSRDDASIFTISPDGSNKKTLLESGKVAHGSMAWHGTRKAMSLFYIHNNDIWKTAIKGTSIVGAPTELYVAGVFDSRVAFIALAIDPSSQIGNERVIGILDFAALSITAVNKGVLLTQDKEPLKLGTMNSIYWPNSKGFIYDRSGSLFRKAGSDAPQRVAAASNGAGEPVLSRDGWLYYSAYQPERQTAGQSIRPKYGEIYRARLLAQ